LNGVASILIGFVLANADEKSNQGCAVLEQHMRGRILAVANCLKKVGVALFTFEVAQRNPPGAAIRTALIGPIRRSSAPYGFWIGVGLMT